MTLSTSTNKITYTCNGMTNEFAVPFLFFADSHISVQIKTNDGQTRTLKQDDDYTLSGAGNAAGGTCVLTASPENGAELLILRDVPYKQETRYIDGDPMPAPLLERNLDALTMMCQQLEEQCARAVAVDMFSASNPSEIIGKVEDLYADKDNLDIVAKNIAAVDVCSDNIEAIKDAPNQASAASASASAALVSQQQSAASATAAENSAAKAAQQAKIATQAAARTDCVDIGSAQTITGIKTLKNVVIAETENVNFVAKNPTMDSAKVPSSPKYTGYDFRDKNNVRVGYIGIKQDSSGSFIYEIQAPYGLASAIHGITPASATENSTAIPTTAWIANQHKRGYGIGLPNYASPTTLSWGTSYTSAKAPQVNGWLYFGGTSTDSDYLLLTMNGFTFNAGAISGAAGFHTLFIPYQAKTAFSTSGGTSGQFLKFFSSL